MENLAQPPITDTKALSEFWDVGQRTIQNWIKKKFWIPYVGDMCQRILSEPKCSKKAKVRAQLYLSKISKGQGTVENNFQPPAAKEEAVSKPAPAMLEEADTGMDLRAYRDMLSRQLQAAYEKKSVMEIQRLEASFFKANKALMEEEAHLKKMGLNDLEVIDRETLRRILYQLCWSMVRGVDSTASKISKKCLKRDFPEEVYFEVHPILMNSNYAIPLLSLPAFCETVGFPKFVKEVILEAFADFHENGIEAAQDYEAVFKKAVAE